MAGDSERARAELILRLIVSCAETYGSPYKRRTGLDPFSLRVYDSEILAEDDPTQSIHATFPQLRRGDRLAGRFVVVQFLARGGMGEVYEAADEHLQDKHCALKTLRVEIGADPVVQQRFEREVLLAREVNHPNVCPTYDIFRAEEAGGLFLTMKLLRGESLGARLKNACTLVALPQ